MNAAAEVLGLLEAWRRCSEGERHGIAGDDWDEVARQQAGKSFLSSQITEALQRFRAGPVTPAEAAQVDAGGAELLALEQRNEQLLRTKREQRAAERRDANETSRNLQGVRRAYGAVNRPLWQSYS